MTAAQTINNETAMVEEAQREANTMLETAQAYIIDSPEMAEAAAEDMNLYAKAVKDLNEKRLSLTRPLDESKKRITQLFEGPITKAEQARDILKNALLNWHTAEEKRLKAEEEERKAEQEKMAEQAKAESDAAEAKLEAAIESGDMAAVADLESKADTSRQAMEAVQFAPPAITTSRAPKGASIRKTYKAEVVDLMTVVKEVAAGNASIELLKIDDKVLNKRVKALGEEFSVKGIRVYQEKSVAATGRK